MYKTLPFLIIHGYKLFTLVSSLQVHIVFIQTSTETRRRNKYVKKRNVAALMKKMDILKIAKYFGLVIPQTGLTKQRKSLREPLKVFPLPRHQHCFGQTFSDCIS